jgi:hypothetical protein
MTAQTACLPSAGRKKRLAIDKGLLHFAASRPRLLFEFSLPRNGADLSRSPAIQLYFTLISEALTQFTGNLPLARCYRRSKK